MPRRIKLPRIRLDFDEKIKNIVGVWEVLLRRSGARRARRIKYFSLCDAVGEKRS
jgi:hypothetical protein